MACSGNGWNVGRVVRIGYLRDATGHATSNSVVFGSMMSRQTGSLAPDFGAVANPAQ
ncbi:MAG: hypothetical protein QOG53_3151 [Frankiales bacterium]|jgi:hypothetical protein|nr:hypothetical protein [Frankiales bacterium]